MSKRVKGYHYAIGSDGRKHRVYPKGKKMSMSSARKSMVPRPLKGRGGYYDSRVVKTLKKYVPRNTFKSLGALAGSTIGGIPGGVLGGLAGSAIGNIAGFGSYSIRMNSLINEGESPARMHSSNANTIVRHREYITDIVSSSTANTFLLQNYAINPGLIQTFPWFSALAQQYQEWEPLGIVFEFKTLSADAIASSTNNTLGGIIMATNYNAAAPNFSNKQAMDNTEYTTSCKPSESFYHAIECAPHQNVLSDLYVRSAAVPSGQDAKTYDLGNFQIASFGIQGTSVVLGELWVSYEIALRKPILTAAAGLDVLTDHYKLGGVADISNFGTSSTLATNSTLGGTISTSGTTYFFPPYIQEGMYLVYYVVQGTANTCVAPTWTLTNCSAITLFLNDSSSQVNVIAGIAGVTLFSVTAIISITGMNAKIVASGSTLPTAISKGDLIVTQFNAGIIT